MNQHQQTECCAGASKGIRSRGGQGLDLQRNGRETRKKKERDRTSLGENKFREVVWAMAVKERGQGRNSGGRGGKIEKLDQ